MWANVLIPITKPLILTIFQVELPLNIHSEYATYETQFGYVQRPTHKNTTWDIAKVCCHLRCIVQLLIIFAQFEVCGHKVIVIHPLVLAGWLTRNLGSTLTLASLVMALHSYRNRNTDSHVKGMFFACLFFVQQLLQIPNKIKVRWRHEMNYIIASPEFWVFQVNTVSRGVWCHMKGISWNLMFQLLVTFIILPWEVIALPS